MNQQQTYQHNNNQQTRRSMIPHTDNPAPSNLDTNIDDILALQLSDTLINAAYQLSALKINLAIQKICQIQRFFIQKTAWGFESIIEWGNRKYQKRHFLKQTDINVFKQQDNTNGEVVIEKKKLPLLLTRQQQQQKILIEVRQKLSNFIKIIEKKTVLQKLHAFILIQQHQHFQKNVSKQQRINSIVRPTNKFQLNLTDQKPHHYIRRSIDKIQITNRGSINQQSSFSLNKNYQSSHLFMRNNNLNINNSPINNKFNPTRLSKNMILTTVQKIKKNQYNKFTKQSTCSQSSAQQQNSHNKSIDINKTNKFTRHDHRINTTSYLTYNSKQYLISPKNYATQNKNNNISINSSSITNPTKQKQLQLLRKKYNKLVNQFKDFSQRFLSVIKQE